MPRTSRVAPGGMVFHVLNRGVGRMRLFDDDDDFEAFERVMEETLAVRPMRICAYSLMPNHWHFVLWPENDGELARFMQRLTIAHVTRWQEHNHEVGSGHVYQGRYKSFPVESDEYFYQVLRYVERNALRAELVERAEDWRWSSLWRRVHGNRESRTLLSDWPLPKPRQWLRLVNEPQTDAEVKALRRCVKRGTPYGSEHWIQSVAKRLGLEATIRPRGRPRKQPE
jgi:putative transposase